VGRTNKALAQTSSLVSDNNDSSDFYTSILDKEDNDNQVTLDQNNIPNFYTKYPKLKGKTYPNATVLIEIHSNPITAELISDSNGYWEYTPTNLLDLGEHTIKITVKEKDTDKILQENEYKIKIVEKAEAESNSNNSLNVGANTNTNDNYWLIWIICGLIAVITCIISFKLVRRKV
jgi:hypothetical protein